MYNCWEFWKKAHIDLWIICTTDSSTNNPISAWWLLLYLLISYNSTLEFKVDAWWISDLLPVCFMCGCLVQSQLYQFSLTPLESLYFIYCLWQIRDGRPNCYILKNKDLEQAFKGAIYLEMDLIYNPVSQAGPYIPASLYLAWQDSNLRKMFLKCCS